MPKYRKLAPNAAMNRSSCVVVACMTTSMVNPPANAISSAARRVAPRRDATPKLHPTKTNQEKNCRNCAAFDQPRATSVRNVMATALFFGCIHCAQKFESNARIFPC